VSGYPADIDRRLRRPFNWGVLIVGDLNGDVPESLAGGFGRTSDSLALAVRHAQDIGSDSAPFEVEVQIIAGPPTNPPDIEHVVSVPSGVLAVGDAESQAELRVPPGDYRRAVRGEPREQPERVVLWVESA
jgi:hypothetical protein